MHFLFLPLFCITLSFCGQTSATPIHSVPIEFFSCHDRKPGKYADVKRNCAYYYQCEEDSSMTHMPCPHPTNVFDDQKNSCTSPELGASQSCPVGTDYFQSASVFCRGRPGPANTGNQDFYPDLSTNCEGYFWCYRVGDASFGVRKSCASGTRFHKVLKACVQAAMVPCGNEFYYPYNMQQANGAHPPP